ncbi:Gem-associated protein 5 [Actinomortierella wolfii]|nr:Gem-associated protein 5 [Actinomortierella wolfii]
MRHHQKRKRRDDRLVICWDVIARRPIYILHNAHETEIKAVEWLYDGVTVVSGDRSGFITIWNPFQGKHTKRKSMDKAPISCIQACPSPDQHNVAAIAYETGDILICQLRLTDTALLRRLHGHSGRIHSLSWQPFHEQVGEAETSVKRDDSSSFTYLASGSADQTIRIWDVDKTRTKMLVKVPGHGNKQGQQQGRVKAWVPVEWSSDGCTFISFTSRGGHVQWRIDGSSDKARNISHGCQHTRMVYQVLVWRTGDFAFSFGMDRRIIVWDLKRSEGIVQVDGLAGPVDAIDVSLLDPGRLAIASGNDSITLWNTLSQDIPFDSIFIDRLTSRVRCLAWHPSEDGTIAFGLDNGKIGMIDRVYEWNPQQALLRPGKYKSKGKSQTSQGPLPLFFPSYHSSTVLSIQWCSSKAFSAPIPELLDLCLEERSSCIVTCGDDGRILVTVVSKAAANKTSLDLDTVLTRQNSAWYEELRLRTGWTRLQRRGVAIHPNEDIMAIGNADGSVEIVELQHFRVVHVYHGHKSRLDKLAWCKAAGGEAGHSIPYILACGGGDDGFISVLHLDQYVPKKQVGEINASATAPESAHSIIPSLNCMQKFNCHPAKAKRRGCSSLDWSPFTSTDGSNGSVYRFASAGYDGSVAVCEITLPSISTDLSTDSSSNTITAVPKTVAFPVARFVAHHQITTTVRWSLTDEHHLYTGGSDWRVCVWDWRKYKVSEDTCKEMHYDQYILPQGNVAAEGSTYGRKKQLQLDKSSKRGVGKSLGVVANEAPTGPEASCNKRPLSMHTDATEEKMEETSSDSMAPPKKKHASKSRDSPGAFAQEYPPEGKKVNLFPKSSAAFKTASKRQSLLEIIRLTRNLYCRPSRGRTDVVDSGRLYRQRWRAMLRFFEADGEPEGQVLAAILRKDVHEMNIDDDDDESDDGEGDMDSQETDTTLDIVPKDNASAKSMSNTSNINSGDHASSVSAPSPKEDESQKLEADVCERQEGVDSDADDGGSDISALSPSKEPKEDDNVDGDAYGDMIFYGSREAIISLAQMESQALAKLDAENGRNIFYPGTGMGVAFPRAQIPPKHGANGDSNITLSDEHPIKTSSTNVQHPSNYIKKPVSSQLSRIPISYWLGDVPDMTDILSSTTTLGTHDWIGLALSPMGGVAAWKAMMAQMARKCLENGEVHSAVLCFLGIGQVFEAVEAYRANNMFREALMLLKIRVWEDEYNERIAESQQNGDKSNTTKKDTRNGHQDHKLGIGHEKSAPLSAPSRGIELQANILADWGRYLEKRGEYEQAAKCQLALGSLLVSSFPTEKTQRQCEGENVAMDTVQSSSSTAGLSSVALAGTTWSMGLQTLSRRGDVPTLRVVAGLAILLDDRFQQTRIQHYRNALAAKRLEDQRRRKLKEGAGQ